MTSVNRKAGTGERTREPLGGNAWHLYSPVGFRHLWLECLFLGASLGGRSLWKNGVPLRLRLSVAHPLYARYARRRQVTEHSERTVEEAEYSRDIHLAVTHGVLSMATAFFFILSIRHGDLQDGY